MCKKKKWYIKELVNIYTNLLFTEKLILINENFKVRSETICYKEDYTKCQRQRCKIKGFMFLLLFRVL